MTTTSPVHVDVRLDGEQWLETQIDDLVAGLSSTPKVLSPVWFYDERGSELFDEITRLPEYYPTRAERSLLAAHAHDIAAWTGADTLVELGSGTSDKTRHLLDAMAAAGNLERYVPFDVSEATVRAAADSLVAELPDLAVHAVIGDFHRHLRHVPDAGRRLVAFLGGTIGNLRPHERHVFLGDVRSVMDGDDRFLIGYDLVKDPVVLVDAYADAAGVTAEFNRNALRHLNRRFDGDLDPSTFRHIARWDPDEEWIEMHLEATDAHQAHLAAIGLDVRFRAGERIRTEISAKFRPERMASELAAAGFDVETTWCTEPGFELALARPNRAAG